MKNQDKSKRKVRVGISIGDVNGIGLEVIIKTFSDTRILEEVTPIIYGSSKVMSYHRKALKADHFNFMSIKDAAEAKSRKINLVSCWEEDVKINLGERTNEGGVYALKSLEAATKDLASDKVDVLVTAPIDKKAIQSKEFKFPGHTEYLANMSGVDEALMLMVTEGLRVGVVTGHIPITEVPKALTKESILNKIKQLQACLQLDFGIRKPKIAVLGLNPHAGENGMLGEEEGSIITPAINAAKEDDILAFGPYPADGFFGSSNFKNFDAILAMYHDQGLIPFKAMTFDRGVNYTAGLPIVRTSPDHGTAYEIAGKNQASESSFRQAVMLAKDVYLTRKTEKELRSNPLKITPPKVDRKEKK